MMRRTARAPEVTCPRLLLLSLAGSEEKSELAR